jgi:hypothetical protein
MYLPARLPQAQAKELNPASTIALEARYRVTGIDCPSCAARIAGEFLAGSQAVKADAPDFVGDGLISFLGLIAIRWELRTARARATQLQGLFLAAPGIVVLVNTAYRVVVLSQPEADLMGPFGSSALVVNVAAALAGATSERRRERPRRLTVFAQCRDRQCRRRGRRRSGLMDQFAVARPRSRRGDRRVVPEFGMVDHHRCTRGLAPRGSLDL